jgi:hypothetical protein
MRRKIMSKLIEQFLETHRQCTVQNSVFNISQALDQEALAIVEQAQTEAHRRSKGKPDDTARQRKLLNSALETQLTRVLDKVDLLNKAHHDTLRNAIQRWCPWQKDKQQACLQVQKVLLSLLPAAQQKQQLGVLCEEYKAHLKNRIEKEIKNNDFTHITCSVTRTIMFEAPPVADRPRISLVKDRRSPVDRLASEPSRYIQDPDKPLDLALQKYQAVSKLEAALATPVKSATEQVKDFNQVFKVQRPLLEKDRDSLAMKFLKGVATVLSLGIAWGLGIWGIKGKVAAEKVQQVLETPKMMTCRVN